MVTFSSCIGDNRRKSHIVLTDGNSWADEIQQGVNYTPAENTLIAVGFGNVNNYVLDIIARNITEHKFQVKTADDLSSVVDSLKSLIG